MLDALRKGAGTWVAKVFIALLVMSFAVWGIADIFRGFGQNVAATVGDTEISLVQFDRTYRRDLDTLGRQIGRPLSTTEGAQFGIPQQTLGKLVAEAALDETARDLSLGISDAELAKIIQQDPSMQGPTGGYDRTQLAQLLRSNGISEDEYVLERHALALRQQLAQGVTGGLKAPTAYLEALHTYQSETRAVDYLRLTAAQLDPIETPDDATLSAFYDERIEAFRAPEQREVVLLELTPEALARPDDISDEQVSAEYERSKDRYTNPEQRTVLQMTFTSQDDATEAAAKLAEGASFEDLMSERNLSENDVSLGVMAQDDFLDTTIGDAVFALDAGATSGVIDGRFSPVILKVTDVQPGATKPFDEMKDEIRQNLALEGGEREVLDLMGEIEDTRAGGASLQEVAERFKLPLDTPVAFDASGNDADGNPVEFPQVEGLVSGAFDSDVGVENDPLQLGSRGFLWYEVTKVTPARDRTLDEVHDSVVTAWQAEETTKRLKELSQSTVEKLQTGTEMATLAEELGVEVQSQSDLSRGASSMGRDAVQAAFSGPVGSVHAVSGDGSAEELVLKVTDSAVPAFFEEADGIAGISTQLTRQLQDSILNQYVVHIEDTAGVEINQAAISQVIGSPAN
ncbi:SurA N-terminal domain-containing protein [Roseibium sp.]|uniref:peptidylprolyl isomerase n=1 Tax=Roseibium sp. TaxID=1936156 RepID=UPI003A98280F